MTREVIFRNDAGIMTVALCAFPACSLPSAPAHRLIRVLSGAMTLTEPVHPPEHLTTGNHAFLPNGTLCTLDIAEGTVAVIVDVTT